MRFKRILALHILFDGNEEFFEQETARGASGAPVISTVAPSATSTVAAVEGWTMAQGMLFKIAWYWFSPCIAKQ